VNGTQGRSRVRPAWFRRFIGRVALALILAFLACRKNDARPAEPVKAPAQATPANAPGPAAPATASAAAPDPSRNLAPVEAARKVFLSLRPLAEAGQTAALLPFLYDRRSQAIATHLRPEQLKAVFSGTIESHEVNGGRVLFHLSGNPQLKVAALYETPEGFKFDLVASSQYREPDPGPDVPENRPISLDEAVAGIQGSGPLQAEIETTKGTLRCRLFPDKAPLAVANFVGLARGLRSFLDPKTGRWVRRPFYDGLTFHRVIPEFMIQGGCPLGNGTGGPGYAFRDEFDQSLRHDRPGRLSMANSGPNTNGSQFFITEAPAPWLDDHHTIFGECEPLELIRQIARVPATETRPNEPVQIRAVRFSR